MEQEKITQIKEIVGNLIGAMGLAGHDISVNQTDVMIEVQITSQEASYLIGRNGDNLMALQQLIRALVGKKIMEALRLTVDVNNYYEERKDSLKNLARTMAYQVAQQKISRALPPMNAYERRIIHLALIDMPGIKTESEGEGERRRIVIKPT